MCLCVDDFFFKKNYLFTNSKIGLLIKSFQESKLADITSTIPKWHMTILNTKYRFVCCFVCNYFLTLLLLLSFRDRSEKQSNLDASHILTTFAETDFGTCRIPSIQLLVNISENKNIVLIFPFFLFFIRK